MREAWEGGRIVPESSAGEAAVAQRAPVEHQAGQSAFPRRGALSTWSTNCSLCTRLCLTTQGPDDANQLVARAIELCVQPHSWLAVDGSERVGASPRQTADLVKNVTINQIHTT